MLSVYLVPMRNCLVVFLVIVAKFCFTFVGIFSNHPNDSLSCSRMGDPVALVFYSLVN